MTTNKDFAHLHVHTDFSLLDGAIQIKPLARRVAELGMKACAITDHGNMHGAFTFYREMKEQGVKPVIGIEAYVAPGDRRDRSPRADDEKAYNHMILLAKDRVGYHNLARLSSKAYQEGFYRKPRIDRELLARYGAGIVGLSGCLSGVPQYHLARGREEEALRSALEFQEILGKGNYFLEIQHHGLADQQAIERSLVELSRCSGIPLVATNDAHYLAREDHVAHDVMLCIGTGKKVTDTDRMRFGGPEFYLRSPEEMYRWFAGLEDAVARTLDVVEMCDLSLPAGECHLPVYPVPPEEGAATVDEYFEKVTRRGFAMRRETRWERMRADGSLGHSPAEYEARLTLEIEMIKRMGFASYFLIVWDFIRYAREQGIPVGPGRGSVSGSLVAYCLEITDIDPLRYDLLFERFLNPDRVSMPDIDVDFCPEGRQRVIDHVTRLYGRDSVCQIVTFGTMASKAAIKDVGRALDMPYAEVEKIAKLIPPPVRGRNVSIGQALETVPELKQAFESDEQVRKVIDIAKRLEGCARHTSVHAAGIVISPRPLEELVPLSVNKEQQLTSQYGMADIEKAGMLKMDFLGLTALTVIAECLKSVRAATGEEVDFSAVPLDDPATYELFAQGKTEAVFQFEGEGIKEITRRLRPKSIEDLSALNALYRPGPLDGGMVEEYIERFHGRKPVEYLVPEMEPILRRTLGVILYQEEIMQLAQALAGYTLAEADLMRRAMGKKKPEEMAVHREKFISGATARGIEQEKAVQIFDLMKSFADYGFNLSHAVSYAYLSFQTAYLKAHYPEHFYAAVLSAEASNTDKVLKYVHDLRALGIRLLPPDVNESRAGFTAQAGSIRYGLSAVRGIGEAAVRSIIEAREERPFTSLYDFAARATEKGINRRVIESLVGAGAFDSLAPKGDTPRHWRAAAWAAVGPALDQATRSKRDRLVGQASIFGLLGEPDAAEAQDKQLPRAKPWTSHELLEAEKEAVGFYISGHPLEDHAALLAALKSPRISDLAALEPNARVRIGGVVTEMQRRTTKRGEPFGFFRLEDASGEGVKCVLWPESFRAFGGILADGTLLIASGRLEIGQDGGLAVICDEVIALAEAALRAARAVTIEFPEETTAAECRDRVLTLLEENPGDCTVFLRIRQRDAQETVVVRSKSNIGVRPSRELEEAVNSTGCKVEWLFEPPAETRSRAREARG